MTRENTKRLMTVWGIGPELTLISLVFFFPALAAHLIWFPLFAIRCVPSIVLVFVGLALISIGLPIWIAAIREVRRAFKGNQMVTQGVYALCRHPIYGCVTFFVVPGLLLFLGSWIVLALPLIMAVLARLFVRREETYLRKKFGRAYCEYAGKVNALFPGLWRLPKVFWYPQNTGPVANNVYAIREKGVTMFLYSEGTTTIAIDTAYGGKALARGLAQAPVNPAALTHCFLTHGDVDHTGGLELFCNARIFLSRDEKQMINGQTARLTPFYHSPRLTSPYSLLDDGDVVTVGPITIQAIATPGHTPGSMSFLVNKHVLFTGDTLRLRNGLVHPFFHPFAKDTKAQLRSIMKLSALQDIDLLCTAHTGCIKSFDDAMKYWRKEESRTKT